jgi:hypothetical protein
MKLRDKQMYRDLQKIAQRLPFNYVEHKASLEYRGSEILEANPEAKDKEGNPIDPKKIYFINGSQRHVVDHYKRMKRIYRRDGEDGVKHYVTEVMALELHAMQPKSFGGIQTQYE